MKKEKYEDEFEFKKDSSKNRYILSIVAVVTIVITVCVLIKCFSTDTHPKTPIKKSI